MPAGLGSLDPIYVKSAANCLAVIFKPHHSREQAFNTHRGGGLLESRDPQWTPNGYSPFKYNPWRMAPIDESILTGQDVLSLTYSAYATCDGGFGEVYSSGIEMDSRDANNIYTYSENKHILILVRTSAPFFVYVLAYS
jgi:hypothetical protein